MCWCSRIFGSLHPSFYRFYAVSSTCAGEAVEPLPEQGVSEIPAIRKPSKETTWLGPKESAVRQHRQEMKTKMKTNKVEEVKPARPKQVRRTVAESGYYSSWNVQQSYWNGINQKRSIRVNLFQSDIGALFSFESLLAKPVQHIFPHIICNSVPLLLLWVLYKSLFTCCRLKICVSFFQYEDFFNN